ncbi:MAG: diguanylate cyclase [Lachnospiraceae bacterium]|nr:diguanylate cyclase [Lachnospiraceae bacterium]MBO4462421.1 diguanylate cyclase [Lachnospiraceae bacterium]
MENSTNARAIFDKGCEYLENGQTDKAVIALQEAAELFDKDNDLAGYARAINAIGVTYAEVGNEALAIEHYMKGLARVRKEKGVGISHLFYNNIGVRYQELGDYQTSIRYFIKAEEDLLALGPITADTARWFVGCYLNTGISYWHTENYLYSELYLYKAKNTANDFDIHVHDFSIEIMFARLYCSIGNYEYAKVKVPQLMEFLEKTNEIIQDYTQDVMELLSLLEEIKEFEMMGQVLERFEAVAKKTDYPQLNLTVLVYKMRYYKAIGDIARFEDACIDHAKYFMEVRHREAEENAVALNVKMELGRLEDDEKEANRLAEEDALTGLKNRYALTKQSKDICERCADARVSIVVGIIDVDFFKEYNDTYGHIEGDDVLRAVAGILRESVVADSQIYRYGGDEFLIIAGQSFYSDAIRFAENIKSKLEALEIPSGNGAEGKFVTVSQGYYTLYPQGTDDFKKIIEEADSLLYRAKRQGKNRYLIKEKANDDNLERGSDNV